VVEALVRAVRKNNEAPADATALADRLRTMHVNDDGFGYDAGGLLFTPHGNRRGGTGEHVVWLRPHLDDGRVLPEATIEVWTWRSASEGGRRWLPVGTPLRATYDEGPPEWSGR
jgi:hypothetical protein